MTTSGPKTVPPQDEPEAPARNGKGDRLDDLADAVQALTEIAQRGITVAELAHASAEKFQCALYDDSGVDTAYTLYLWHPQATRANRLGTYVRTITGQAVGGIRSTP